MDDNADRCGKYLLWPSLSMEAMLLWTLVTGFAGSKRRGKLDCEKSTLALKAFASSMLSIVPDSFTFSLRLDVSVERFKFLPKGHNPFCLKTSGGELDCSDLQRFQTNCSLLTPDSVTA